MPDATQSNAIRPDLPPTVPLPAPLPRQQGNWSPPAEWENYPADSKAFSLDVEYPDSPGGMLD